MPIRTVVKRNLQSVSRGKSRPRSFFLFVVLPSWLLPGLLDWYFHRRTQIEQPENGGTVESLIHSSMFMEGGIPLLLGTFFEVNPLTVCLMTGAAALHELMAMVDVRWALRSNRRVTQWEQHVHSFLEVMPFVVIPFTVLLHPPATKKWKVIRRSSALTKRDLVFVTGAVIVAGALPYGEELLRCARHGDPAGAFLGVRAGSS
jgi:hypothetical protein